VRMANPTYGDHAQEDVQHTPSCTETRVPKNKAYDFWHRVFGKYAGFSECSALVSTLAVHRHPEYLSVARRIAENADIVMHSSPFMGQVWPKPKKDQVLVYDSYNVEYKLARESLGNGLWGRWGANRIRRIEGSLCRNADLVLVCSREDGEEMAELYGLDGSKTLVVPNGVDVSAIHPAPNKVARLEARERAGLSNRPVAFFLGSFHPPNIESAQFIVEELAPEGSEIDFLVAGKVCEAFQEVTVPDNVKLLGLISEELKNDLMLGIDVALNPMFSGSGTNLKMLEYLAFGLPIITTGIGARGIDLTSGENAMIVHRSTFLQGIRDLLDDPQRQQRLRTQGRVHAESNFDWAGIVGRLRDVLRHRTSPRLLMLNDYPITPVDSGGKSRLNALACTLSERVAPVTTLSLTKSHRGSIVQQTKVWQEVTVPRPSLLSRIDQIVHRITGVTPDDVVTLVCSRLLKRYRARAEREVALADVVLLNHIYMAPVGFSVCGEKPLVYESHNCEALLKESLFRETSLGRWFVSHVERNERGAVQDCDLVSCVADTDRTRFLEQLRGDGGKVVLALNGIDVSSVELPTERQRVVMRRQMGFRDEPLLVFLGSGHPPNRDAVDFLIKRVADEIPDATFLIVGSVGGWFVGKPLPENVIMIGSVSEVAKARLLSCADVALNPLFEGSGSSLKVPEYLSYGLPVMTTPVGIRGFDLSGIDAVRVAEADQFATALQDLLGENLKAKRDAARQIAEKELDWNVLLESLVERLNDLVSDNVDLKSRESAEVLNRSLQ